jgi:hypothetical protein
VGHDVASSWGQAARCCGLTEVKARGSERNVSPLAFAPKRRTVYSAMVNTAPSLRPKTSGKYISYAFAGMVMKRPGTLARIR